jgi:hypothetical protein
VSRADNVFDIGTEKTNKENTVLCQCPEREEQVGVAANRKFPNKENLF